MKTIWRISPVALVVTVMVVAMVARLSRSGPPPPDDSGDTSNARTIRQPLGFGPVDAIPALAGDESHQEMIAAAQQFAGIHAEVLDPLLVKYDEAQRELVRQITWGNDADIAYEELEAAAEAIVDACLALSDELDDGLPILWDDLAARNLVLDPDLRLLGLSDDQRALVVAAQKQRNSITLNAQYWHKPDALAEAEAAFEEELASILNEMQRGESCVCAYHHGDSHARDGRC